MPTREGIGFVPFKGVQCILNFFDERGNLQSPHLEMAKRKPRPDCRNEQIADIGEIEAEKNPEQGLLEFAESAFANEHNAEREWDEIITDVGELEEG